MRSNLRQFVSIPILLLAVGWSAAATEQQVLRAAVSDTNTPPYAIFDDAGKLSAGLSKDILDALASISKLDIQYLDLPRTRIEGWLESGQADVACFLNPDWVTEPDLYHWSPPLFRSMNDVSRGVPQPPSSHGRSRAD